MKNLILSVISLIFSSSSYALTVNVTVKGEDIRYENARAYDGSFYLTTTSEIFSGLEPTRKWIPAVEKETTLVTLTNGTSQAEVNVGIYGLEFDWGGLHSSIDTSDFSHGSGLENARCSPEQTSSGVLLIISAANYTCISNYPVVSGKKENIPFYFVRPMFRLPDLSTALKGKPEGVYVGSLNVPVRYYFYNSMSIFTYRNLSLNLTFQVNYLPEVFTSLVVTPENGGVMPPHYGSGTVKGETRFNIETLGYFNTGIKMKFDTSKDYSLAHASQAEEKIPYYVHCDICDDKVIVDEKGKITTSVLNNAGVVLAPVGRDKTRINYNLTVGYSDKTVNQAVTGSYSDSFVVVFGLDF